MIWGLRQQLLLPLLGILISTLAIAAASSFASAESAARMQLELQLQQVAKTVSDARFPLTEPVLAQMKGFAGADFILSQEGRESITTLAGPPPRDFPETHIASDWQSVRFGPSVEIAGEKYLLGGIKLAAPHRQAGAVVYILYPLAQWRSSIWLAAERSLWVIGTASLAALLATMLVARRIVTKIETIREGTSRIAAGDLSPLSLADWRDELGELARSIDSMTAKLHETEHLRLTSQLGSGLAHHFRNGLAGIRLAIQVHQRSCKNAADRESLDIALQSLAVLVEKLHSFLQLVRTGQFVVVDCSLRDVVQQTLNLVQPQCRHGKIEIRWQAPQEPFLVRGDADQLSTMLMNLVTNAMDAAGPGGWIEVRLYESLNPAQKPPNSSAAPHTSGPNCIMMEVVDSGAGPTSDISKRLFQTFATNKAGGIGLGLWIARQIARSHQGEIEWLPQESPSCFRVRLPKPQRDEG